MDPELLDLIADYVEARRTKRDYPDLFDERLSVDPEEIAGRIVGWSADQEPVDGR